MTSVNTGPDVTRTVNPTVLVIFGVTGDLARRKLIPGLFHLHRKGLLPPLLQIVGFSRAGLSDDALRALVREVIGVPPAREVRLVDAFARSFVYRRGLFEDGESYGKLAASLGRMDREWKVCANKLFYLAVPPRYYGDILKNLDVSGLTEPCSPSEGWTRVIVEKPFGKDLASAESLDLLLGKLFREEQIYRIDHYLGKETVQNILAFRFSNAFLAPTWDGRSVENITVRLWEADGVGKRGEFYDGIGALRDVGQNHVLQLLALFTMDRPEQFSAESIRDSRLRALRSVKPLSPREIRRSSVRGQYAGYREERGVAPRSATETYFRIAAELDMPTWRGVSITLESGKKLARSKAEVVVTFRHAQPCLCLADAPGTAGSASGVHYQNVLRYEIQPDERITMSLFVKRPGADMVIEERDFSFDYRRAYGADLFTDPYEKLLLDTIQGNQTLFVSTEEVKASWRFIDPISRAWEENAVPLLEYRPGSMPPLSSP